MKSQQIRKQFLDFFASKGHYIETSAPIVLKDDPTLMFTNAGMNQFKDLFLGHGQIKHPRVADTQKCLRVSGKHNDLEEVGVDTYHHTMFEMLGNWSFGDYFKEQAIEWAWELLTDVYKIDKSKLYVTVFEGDPKENLAFDQEAFDIWTKYIPAERIIGGNKKDNFWEMGEQGPCGPCSEIHIDLRSEEEKTKTSGRDLVNSDHPQVVEIWNLVFMQFNRKADGSLEALPAQHVDTGMGFERLCMALQGKQSNYDTDIFAPYIEVLCKFSGRKYGEDKQTDIAIRVISDHIRAVAFAIADGQLPTNSGAGYVIRRILRRAVRYGYSFLDLKEPFFYRLVDIIDREMGDSFPEIRKNRKLIESVIREEELSFLSTLERGISRLSQIEQQTEGDVISGEKLFELYDTYGFPIDLTALMLKEKGKQVDYEGFESQMKAQKERARAASSSQTDDWQVLSNDTGSEFVGYDTLRSEVRISRYRRVKDKKGETYQLVFPVTPFYAQSGGQVGDTGYIEASNGKRTPIIDTIKENNLTLHIVKSLPEGVDLSAPFTAQVDQNARQAVSNNHSATHLLHKALRTVLGTHVEQKGSMVGVNGLRFDFSHFTKLSDEELQRVEDIVNEDIKAAYPLVEQRDVAYTQALKEGVIALFNEKYSDNVRTIRFGDSYELCGGCHTNNTINIRLFKILSEGGIAAGVRRIDAVTADAAVAYYKSRERDLYVLRDIFKGNPDVEKAATSLIVENSLLKKELELFVKEKVKTIKHELKRSIIPIGGANFLSGVVELHPEFVKSLIFELADEVGNVFAVIGNKETSYKAGISVYISKDLIREKQLHAGKIIKEIAPSIGGGGGGQDFYATAGGKNPEGLVEAIAKAEEILSKA